MLSLTKDRKDVMVMAKNISLKEVKKDSLISRWLEELKEEEIQDLFRFCICLAIFERASDLHFKPYERHISVLLRKEGELEEIFSFNVKWYEQFLRLIKNSAHLPSYKHGIPQEGRLLFPFNDKQLFVRVSIFPTVLGEKVVCRILNFKEGMLTLDELGMSYAIRQTYTDILQNKKGMIIISGPAGSGKTTTLYASLLWLLHQSGASINISTIEDPVEYIIEEFNQTQVNPDIGLTFPQGLRSLLRQDPNILAVGEIRDKETALVALQAGLSGHLIFTTLHAHSAKGVITRLQEFGASQSTINMSVRGILYQELVPKICANCEKSGCEACNYHGSKGRTGKFDILIENETPSKPG